MPEEGEMVLATCTNVTHHGAYFTLDEYPELEKGIGFVHISEISQRWVRNIRDFVREGAKVVARVQRTDPSKGHVDMSIRRVSDSARRIKIQEWKNAQKVDNIIRLVGEALEKDTDTVIKEVGRPLEEQFGSIYAGLEAVSEHGEKPLIDMEIGEDWIPVIVRIAQSSIELPYVTVSGALELSSTASNGVEVLRGALEEAEKLNGSDVTKIEITSIGAPQYRILIEAKDYKSAEKAMENAVNLIIKKIEAVKGTGTFERIK
jgi:translation initiation factor 2 subunit 1